MVRARKLAPESLADFGRYVFKIEPPLHALVWIELLEALERRAFDKLCVVAPPGHAKSTYHSIIFPSWYLGRHPNETLIGVTTTGPLGELYGETIRSVIEDPNGGFGRVFPNVKPWKERGWTKSEGFFLKGPVARSPEQKDSSLIFTGAGGPVIGRRAHGVIVDDAVDEATARSETLLEARKLWIRRSVFSRLKPKGWRIICGTLWTEDDVVDSAMRTGEYVTVHMEARSPGSLVVANVWIPNGIAWRPSEAVG